MRIYPTVGVKEKEPSHKQHALSNPASSAAAMPSATIVPVTPVVEAESKPTITGVTPTPARITNGESKGRQLDAKLLGLNPNLITSYPTHSLDFLKKLRDQGDKQNGLRQQTRPIPQAKLRMDIVVVGAGLGGLAAAIALALRGHSVTVLEQAPALEEVSGNAHHGAKEEDSENSES